MYRHELLDGEPAARVEHPDDGGAAVDQAQPRVLGGGEPEGHLEPIGVDQQVVGK